EESLAEGLLECGSGEEGEREIEGDSREVGPLGAGRAAMPFEANLHSPQRLARLAEGRGRHEGGWS
ncbi:MAG: hypothetical protein SGPRY_007253, partial [Prymnesium sp.]